MLYLERLLQINMATLAATGALMLGMGERSLMTPLMVTAAAAISIWLTDLTGWFRLSRRVSNVLMLVAAASSLIDLYRLGSALQTLGLGRYLVCLQIILLFQQKDGRTYWVLVMLSLLEVVMATLFTQGVWFGVMLVAYMLLGFSAMTLLLLHRQWEHHQPALAAAHSASPSIDVNGSRWPLAGQRTEFASSPAGSGHAGIGGDLFGRLGRIGLQTLALAFLLFFTVPRSGPITWRSSIVKPPPVVGFSDSVALGETRSLSEDRNEVMRVQFSDYRTDVPLPYIGEIYLQGALLNDYHHGQWQSQERPRTVGGNKLHAAPILPQTGLVRQEIRIEGLDRNELFFVAPWLGVASESNLDVIVDNIRDRLLRVDDLCAQRFSYVLATTAIVDGRQKPLVPALPGDVTKYVRNMPADDDLPAVAFLAKRWLDESGLPKADRVGRARFLEQQLAASGRFQYTLVGRDRDPDIDPIEDFLTKQPLGNCEYFATALTLMLRSQGIPARMVVGYKCSEWNLMGGYYEVRQLHAHTWVQAYLPPEQIPPELVHGRGLWPWSRLGGWLQLDPTPASEAGEVQAFGWLAALRRAQEWLDSAWTNYVVDLDYRLQRDAIYQPIIGALQSAIAEVADRDRWREVSKNMAARLHIAGLSGVADWLALTMAAILAVTILAVGGWLLWRIGRRLCIDSFGKRSRRARRRVRIESYHRFETLLAKRGLVRSRAQTQREFAAAAGVYLATRTGENRLASLPAVVADAFYRVRFGGQPLDTRQAQAVEHALAEIAAAATTARRDAGRRS